MTNEETVTIRRREYEALMERKEQLEDILAARTADDGVRVPHAVAVDIMRGQRPFGAFRRSIIRCKPPSLEGQEPLGPLRQ